MHSYIRKNELIELIQGDRKGFIVNDIRTKDIDEYINSLSCAIKECGINTNIFTQAKIKKNTNGSYVLYLIIRKHHNIDNIAYRELRQRMRSVVDCITIQEALQEYKNIKALK